MFFEGMLFGVAILALSLYVAAGYLVWNLSAEGNSKISHLTLKEWATKMYCMHPAIRLFETAMEDKEA